MYLCAAAVVFLSVTLCVCVLCVQPHASTGTADGPVIVMTACKTGVAIIVDITESRTLKLTYTYYGFKFTPAVSQRIDFDYGSANSIAGMLYLAECVVTVTLWGAYSLLLRRGAIHVLLRVFPTSAFIFSDPYSVTLRPLSTSEYDPTLQAAPPGQRW